MVTPSIAFKPVACSALIVLVEIDETGSDDETRSVNHSRARQRMFADGRNLVAANTDVANSVERCFGIDDASAVEHHVITGLGEGCAAGKERQQQQDHARDKRIQSAWSHIAPAMRARGLA